jgi:uncharacterized membrane protein YfcA
MARSHHRYRKHHPRQQQHAVSSRPKRKAAAVFIIFLGVFGSGLGYFATGTIPALIAGAIIGGIIGYLIGHNLDKMASR